MVSRRVQGRSRCADTRSACLPWVNNDGNHLLSDHAALRPLSGRGVVLSPVLGFVRGTGSAGDQDWPRDTASAGPHQPVELIEETSLARPVIPCRIKTRSRNFEPSGARSRPRRGPPFAPGFSLVNEPGCLSRSAARCRCCVQLPAYLDPERTFGFVPSLLGSGHWIRRLGPIRSDSEP